MGIRANAIDCSIRPWHGKVIASLDSYLKQHFSGEISNCYANYTALFVTSNEFQPTAVRLVPSWDEKPRFEVTFNATNWETKDEAVPKAIRQLLGALIAIGDHLGLTVQSLRDRCKALGIQPAEAVVGPPGKTPPAAEVHPRAREILSDEIFWEIADDYGPIGNDTGSDVYAGYREWRASNPARDRGRYFNTVLRQMELPETGPSSSSEAEIAGQLESNHFVLLTWDDTIIALAIAQIAFDGHVDRGIRDEALRCVGRELSGAVLSFRDWDSSKTRVAILTKVKQALDRAPVE